MCNVDAVIMITHCSLTHTTARAKANENNVRIISMPALLEETLNRCVDIDYNELKNRILCLRDKIDNVKTISITTDKGTDITLDLTDRVWQNDTGVPMPGETVNLPAGELFIAPVESGAEGKVVVDGSMAGLPPLTSQIELYFEAGRVINISGEHADILQNILQNKDKTASIIAEFGIGLNPKAVLCGSVLEDEKVMGTVHIAIGNNINFGGKNKAEIHLDGVILEPTLKVDDRKIIMDKGRLCES